MSKKHKKKKMLIITYYWPPAGGPGVQRWLMFTKYLRDFGVEPVVYVPKNPHYPIVDKALAEEVPEGITVLRKSIREPYGTARLLGGKKTQRISRGIIRSEQQSPMEKFLLWVRGNFFIPDARKNWVKPSVHYLKKYLTNEKIDAVITTGPPHSVHLIGLRLKQATGIQWIADFRDPWTTIGYHKKLKLTRASQHKHKELEEKVLQTADKIITTSPTTRKAFKKLTNQPIKVITNGYDTAVDEDVALDEKFTLSHIGSLLSERNPKILWKALSELVADEPGFADDFRLKLIGNVSQDIHTMLSAYGLDKQVEYQHYIPHKEAVERQQRSQLLLLVEIDSPETCAIIPGKLFEYMAARRPIVALGPKASDVKGILKKTATGSFFDYHNKKKLKNALREHYQRYKKGKLTVAPKKLEQYHRRELTRQLSKWIG